MPVYEYECDGCRRRFEIEQKISDPVLTECPRCRGKVRRLIGGGGGFIIKGSASQAGGHRRRGAEGCSFEQTGTTCCGGDSRCDNPHCDFED